MVVLKNTGIKALGTRILEGVYVVTAKIKLSGWMVTGVVSV